MLNVIRLKEQVRRKSCHAERKFANKTFEGFSEIFTKNFLDYNVVYLLITFNQYLIWPNNISLPEPKSKDDDNAV